jgi:hypothetical protein
VLFGALNFSAGAPRAGPKVLLRTACGTTQRGLAERKSKRRWSAPHSTTPAPLSAGAFVIGTLLFQAALHAPDIADATRCRERVGTP